MDAIVTAPSGLGACFRCGERVEILPVVAVKVDDAAQSDGSVYVIEGEVVRALASTRLFAGESPRPDESGSPSPTFIGILTETQIRDLLLTA
jgi:hypothetical protein